MSRFEWLTLCLIGCTNSAVSVTHMRAATDAGIEDASGVSDGSLEDAGEISDSGQDGAVLPERLTVQGAQLLDPSGTPIVLRGWSWGSWGTEQPNDPSDHVKQGANVVRIPLRWWGPYPDGVDSFVDDATRDYVDDAHLDTLWNTVKSATDAGLWVDLFIDSNCGQGSFTYDTVANCGTADDGVSAANFSNSATRLAQFQAVWTRVATKFAGLPRIAMYELLPEPEFGCTSHGACQDLAPVVTFYKAMIPIVRKIDPRTPLLVGPTGGYRLDLLSQLQLPNDKGLVYTVDLFEPGLENANWPSLVSTYRSKYDVPIFIQQVGVRKSAMNATSLVASGLSQLDELGIGWAWWTYREPSSPMGNGYAPYWQDAQGTWQVSASWLALITSYF